MMITFTQNRTLIATVQTTNREAFDLNKFLALFVGNGHFVKLAEYVFGIIPLNSQTKAYSVSFKPGNEAIIQDLLQIFGSFKEIQTPSHQSIRISFAKPKPPPQTITLWPMSHEVSHEMLQNLVEENGWGKMLKFQFGRHKHFPQFHNAYLHIQIDQYVPNAIPDKITINNNSVMVLKPGESNTQRCNFCKSKGHTIATCPLKRQRTQQQSQRPNNPNRSFASIVSPQTVLDPISNTQASDNSSMLKQQSCASSNICAENSDLSGSASAVAPDDSSSLAQKEKPVRAGESETSFTFSQTSSVETPPISTQSISEFPPLVSPPPPTLPASKQLTSKPNTPPHLPENDTLKSQHEREKSFLFSPTKTSHVSLNNDLNLSASSTSSDEFSSSSNESSFHQVTKEPVPESNTTPSLRTELNENKKNKRKRGQTTSNCSPSGLTPPNKVGK